MRASDSAGTAAGKYRTTNWGEYNAALRLRGSLTMWLDCDMQWLAAPTGKRGRHPTFSDAAIQLCLSIKCLFGLPLRQSLGLVQSVLLLSGLDWPVPDFSTLSRRQKTLHVKLLKRASAQGFTCWWTAQASSFWAKVSRNAKSTGLNIGANSARFT